jgi:predicted metal-dependent hydrolase
MRPQPPPDFLAGYPLALVAQVHDLIETGRFAELWRKRYPRAHEVRTDGALYAFVQALKATHLRSAPPLSKVSFDSRIHVIRHALGTHTAISRVQGGKLQAKREIRISALFREGPIEFLRMIVVHELAHLRQREHDKAFYQLCRHMEPHYHQYEFDLRAYLTYRARPGGSAPALW